MRSHLRDESDDDLIEQQRAFLQSRAGAPAAIAKRIGKQQRQPDSAKPTSTLADDAPSLEILGEVVEKVRRPRQHGSATGQHEPVHREGFPKATHRKASKFSLARKAQSQAHDAPQSAAQAPRTAHADAPRTGRQANDAAGTAASGAAAGTRAPRPAMPLDPESEEATVENMMRENDEFIAKLSATEIRHLRDEIQTSLKPELLSKLAARKRESPQGTPTTVGAAKPVARGGRRTTPAASPHPLHKQAAQASAKPVRPSPNSAGGLAASTTSPPPLPALVRTRFATDGLPVGWLTDEEVARGTSAADVAMRDPLRREEGSVAVGYTIEEAVLLLRSTHPHLQRAALKTLAAVSWRARPRLTEVWQPPGGGGTTPQQAAFTPAVPAGAPPSAAVPWRQVWAHLLHESVVAAPVLQLLQRPSTIDASVRAEALRCLTALLSVPWELRALCEFSWGRPFEGWPMTPSAALRRRVPAAPWQMAAEPVLPPDGEAAAPDPLSVLESDALLGALFMGLLPALAADLRAPHTAQRHAALDVVLAVVLNGPEACLSILACTPLLQALRSVMVSNTEKSGTTEAEGAVHVRVLEVVQLVAASSPEAAWGISDAGLLDLPRAVLLSEQWASPSMHPLAGGPGAAAAAAAVVGCVRLWRACVPMRVFFLSLDDAFPCVLALLAWAQHACYAPSTGSDDAPDAEEATRGTEPPALYIPDAATLRAMREQLQGRAGQVEVSVEAPSAARGAEGCSGAMHDWQAWAIAQVAIQEIALLVAVLLQHDMPAQAQPPAWQEHAALPLPDGCGSCDPMSSPGCIQQLVPHLVKFLGQACAVAPAAGAGAPWPAAVEWLEVLSADADATQQLPQELPARQPEETRHRPPPHPPSAMHAALLQPRAALHQGAVNACLLAVDALATPRSPLGLPVVADRSRLLSDAMSHGCFRVPPRVPVATASGVAVLQLCLETADACEAAAVRATVRARAASVARRAGGDASTDAIARDLAQECVQAARAVAHVGASAAAASSVALAFGPWAAVRTHATHLAAAGLLRVLRVLVTVSGGQLPEGFACGSDMEDVLRALVLVPTLTTSASTARQAMQVLFSPALITPCAAAAARARSAINLSATPGDTGLHMVPGPALLAAYSAAWTGSGAPVPLSTPRGAPADEPVAELLPCMWMDAACGAGQRLPAPPDWFVLAVAARVDTAHSGDGASVRVPSAGELSAAVLAAAVTWVLGAVEAGACRVPTRQPAFALAQGWHRPAIVMNVLRMVYLSSDAALGQQDAHSMIMEHLLASDALRAAVHACMHTLARDPVPAPPVDPSAATLQGPGFAMHVLRRLGQLSLEQPGPALEAAPAAAGFSGAALADVAEQLAQQYASCSLGDTTFAHAVLLTCRPDWGCGERVWRALCSGGALATLPPLADAVGGGEVFVAAAAQQVGACAAAGALGSVQLRDAAAAGPVAATALWDGCWDSKVLHRCSVAGTACAAGVLWGAWLLGAVCESCCVRQAGAGGGSEADGGATAEGADDGGAAAGLLWQLQLAADRLEGKAASEAAVELLAAAVVWAARCLRADAGAVARSLEHAAGERLRGLVGEAARGLCAPVARLGSG